ncbi:MAG: hypothetical protein Q7R84_02690 [bacterium]|nr:hypothetical protein [bacterium]
MKIIKLWLKGVIRWDTFRYIMSSLLRAKLGMVNHRFFRDEKGTLRVKGIIRFNRGY